MGLIFDLQKCKLMHFGYNNYKYQYSLGIEMLNVSPYEKILGGLINDKLTIKDNVYIVKRKLVKYVI